MKELGLLLLCNGIAVGILYIVALIHDKLND